MRGRGAVGIATRRGGAPSHATLNLTKASAMTDTPAINWVAINAKWMEEERTRQQELAAAKPALLAALASRDIAVVTISYDGSGDDGQIQAIEAFKADNTPVALIADIPIVIGQGEGSSSFNTLHECLDDFAWACLNAYHQGFEDNDGGYGEITIHVAAGRVEIDHAERFTDAIHSGEEF